MNAGCGMAKSSKATGTGIVRSVVLPPEYWELLDRVAIKRKHKDRGGVGRASVSEVVRDLIESRRAALEKEAKRGGL